MELHEKIENIDSSEALSRFIDDLRGDLRRNRDDWENVDLDAYLEAMSAWVGSMNNAYRNMGGEVSEQPTWRVFADILLAAKHYE